MDDSQRPEAEESGPKSGATVEPVNDGSGLQGPLPAPVSSEAPIIVTTQTRKSAQRGEVICSHLLKTCMLKTRCGAGMGMYDKDL
jgi:hypothetical protein